MLKSLSPANSARTAAANGRYVDMMLLLIADPDLWGVTLEEDADPVDLGGSL